MRIAKDMLIENVGMMPDERFGVEASPSVIEVSAT